MRYRSIWYWAQFLELLDLQSAGIRFTRLFHSLYFFYFFFLVCILQTVHWILSRWSNFHIQVVHAFICGPAFPLWIPTNNKQSCKPAACSASLVSSRHLLLCSVSSVGLCSMLCWWGAGFSGLLLALQNTGGVSVKILWLCTSSKTARPWRVMVSLLVLQKRSSSDWKRVPRWVPQVSGRIQIAATSDRQTHWCHS